MKTRKLPKKLLAKLLTLVLLVGLGVSIMGIRPAEAANATVSLSPATGTYDGAFNIKVRVSGTDVAGIELTLPYSTTLVSVSSVTLGSGISTWTELAKTTTGGTITYSIAVAYNNKQPFTGTEDVATIRFVPKAAGTLTLAFSDAVVYDSASAEQTVSDTGGTYTISGTGGVDEPSAAISLPLVLNLALGGVITGVGGVGVCLVYQARAKRNQWMH
jgi:hypothetical protein